MGMGDSCVAMTPYWRVPGCLARRRFSDMFPGFILGHGWKNQPRPPAINHELARSIVESAIRIYFRKRRSRVPRFVDETYSVLGSMRLHKHAIGHDLWRAPFNALMAGPQLGLTAAAYAFEFAGRKRDAQWLKSRELFVRTTVAQEIERRIIVDLLELPYSGPGKTSFKDALAIEIMGDKGSPTRSRFSKVPGVKTNAAALKRCFRKTCRSI